MEEPFQRTPACSLDLLQGGPAGDEVAEQRRVDAIEPLQYLRVVLFQRTAQSVGDPDPVIDQVSALLYQTSPACAVPRFAVAVAGSDPGGTAVSPEPIRHRWDHPWPGSG